MRETLRCRGNKQALCRLSTAAENASRAVAMIVQWVKQEDADGCVIACYAMLTGQTYVAAKREVAHLYRRGMSTDSATSLLTDGGWWQQVRYRNRYHYSDDRSQSWEREPWPPEPWAPVHLATVVVAGGSGQAHGVVMLEDGAVLDPFTTEPRRLTDYTRVDAVIGLLPPLNKGGGS